MCLLDVVLRWIILRVEPKRKGQENSRAVGAAAVSSGSCQGDVTPSINVEMNNLCCGSRYHGWA